MRSFLFYPRLAVSGMRRNKILYVPYLLAASLMVMLFYILSSMTWIVGNSGIKGGSSMSVLLMLSSVVCGLLTVLILFYLNGYVIKQRSREFGLYSVLGLGKGNLCLLLFWEILFSCIGSLICGILAGAVFSQLMYLLLLNITRLPVDLEIWVPMGAVNITVYLFLTAWGIVLLRNVIRIFRSDPIEILRRTSQGEQEPRSRWLIALTGACTLTAGYALALAVHACNIGAEVWVVGSPAKEMIFRRYPIQLYFSYQDEALVEKFCAFGPKQVDMILDGVGAMDVVNKLLFCLRRYGTVGIYGWNDRGKRGIDVFSAGNSILLYADGYDEEEAHGEVSAMILQGRLRAEDWYDTAHPVALEDIAAAYQNLKQHKALKYLIQLS